MFRRLSLILCGLLAASATAAGAAAGSEIVDPIDQIGNVDVVPRYDQWSVIPIKQREILKDLSGVPAEQRDRLVSHGSAIERGIGIFIADQHGDVEALISYAELLEDHEYTVQFAQSAAGVGEYAQADQTVSEYLSAVYLEWFGVDVDGSIERFETLFEEDVKPEHLVKPWIVSLRRAKDDPKATAKIKQQITKLPEDVQWAVLSLGYKNSVYAAGEARKLLTDLSVQIHRAIEKGKMILPDEPLFRMNDGDYQRVVTEAYLELLNSRPAGNR